MSHFDEATRAVVTTLSLPLLAAGFWMYAVGVPATIWNPSVRTVVTHLSRWW